MKSRSNLGARNDAGLREFAARMAAASALQDGAMAARIVGEFSAGKTRLLRELLGDLVPERIAPISSREVQTRLPLEVCFGPAPALHVVERGDDIVQGRHVAVLDRFPARGEIDAGGYSPQRHRLRLHVPFERLILHRGDFWQEGEEPRRLFLIDMPGWNSDDDLAAEAPDVLLGSRLNLGLVYVCSSLRLDSAGNRRRLRAFLEALGAANFLDNARLIFVVTHCAQAESAALAARARSVVERIWREIDDEGDGLSVDLELEVLCAEFKDMPAPQLQEFRRRFWDFLLAPLGASDAAQERSAHPWHDAIRAWPPEWDIRPRLRQTHALLGELRELVRRARVQGNFLHGMNRHRLVGMDEEAVRAKLHKEWRRQTGFSGLDGFAARLDAIRLEPGHPLAAWWRDVWFDQARLMTVAARVFATRAQEAIDAVGADTPDIEQHLRRRLDTWHARAQAGLASSFARLVEAAHGLADAAPEQAVASLLALGALQGRYEQHYTAELQRLRQEAHA